MTMTERIPAESRITMSGIGFADLDHDVSHSVNADQLAGKLGIKSLSCLIALVIERHYPADIFPANVTYGAIWGGEHGGEDIDPGVKWIALLRMALEEVAGAE